MMHLLSNGWSFTAAVPIRVSLRKKPLKKEEITLFTFNSSWGNTAFNNRRQFEKTSSL